MDVINQFKDSELAISCILWMRNFILLNKGNFEYDALVTTVPDVLSILTLWKDPGFLINCIYLV